MQELMQELRKRLAELAAASAVVKIGDERKKAARARVAEWLTPGDRLHARIAGQSIGTVSVSERTETAYVADEEALLAWVEEHAAHNVKVVRSVEPAYREQLLKAATEDGAALVYVDGKATGETIPGIKLHPTGGVLRVDLSEAQLEQFAWAVGEGLLTPDGELVAGDGE